MMESLTSRAHTKTCDVAKDNGQCYKDNEVMAAQSKYKTLVQAAPVVIMHLSREGRVLEWNPEAEALFGKKRMDVIGENYVDIFLPEEVRGEVLADMDKVADGKQTRGFVNPVVSAGGEERIISWNVNPLEDPITGQTGILAIGQDITKYKKIANELRCSEEKYRYLVENINDVIYMLDKDGVITYVSPAVELNDLGFRPPDSVGKHFSDVVYPEDVHLSEEQFKKVISGESGIYEYRMVTKTGEMIWLRDSSRPTIKNGEIVGIQGVIRDITEQKEAQEALRLSEEKYRLVINNIPDVVWTSDREGRTTFISPNVKDVYGFTQEEIYASGPEMWFGRIHPEDLERVKSTYESAFEKGEKFDLEYRIKKKDGTYIWLHDRGLANYADDKSEYVYGIFSDITERKKTEDKLKVLSSVIEQSDNSVVITNLDGRFEYANPKYLDDRRLKREDIIGMNWEDVVKKSSPYLEKFEKINETVSGHIRKWRGTVLERTEGGEMRWKESVIYPITDEQGCVTHNVFISTDITDKKKAEIELQNFFDLSSDLMMIVKLDAGEFLRFNPACERIMEYSNEELRSMSVFDIDHPRNRAKNIRNLFEAKEKGERSLNFETLTMTKSGVQKWFNVTANLDPDRDILYAVARDITEQKENHTELMKRLMNFNMGEGNVYLAKEKSVNQSVDAFCDLLGVGFFGTMFSRKQKTRYRCLKEGMFDHYWLAEAEYDGAIEPKVELLQEILDELPGKDAIFIDRLDYLISKNGFKKVLSFIQRLSELAYLRDMIVIISVDPGLLSPTELRAIEKESKELEPLHKSMLSSELADILRLVFKKTGEKINTDFNILQEELNISRPTAIKRVWELANFGYLVETKKGKKKVFELTEKGQNLFH